ncbi:hypothetical protein ACH5RR_026778 [Cinchona calisaya]|uniref:Uncharacterized protein n=1 Tax=Cinchona calisaya TaxID=153742 RepID=A0ABD2Z5F6_9GENT
MENLEAYLNQLLEDSEEARGGIILNQGQSAIYSPKHGTLDTPMLPCSGQQESSSNVVEGGIQNGNLPELLDKRVENMRVYDAAQGGISLNKGQSAIYAPEYGTTDIPMLPWSQGNHQGDQFGQFLLPSIEYNSSVNATILPELSFTGLGSQQQSCVQQSDQTPHNSNTLTPIPILVKAKSNSTKSALDTVTASPYLYRDQSMPGSSFANQQPLTQTFSWPFEQLSQARSSRSSQELPLRSTYQGLSLGSSSNPGALFIGTYPNAREIDLSSWALASTSKQRGITWEADATPNDDETQNGNNIFETSTNQMPTRYRSYDPRYADLAHVVNPHLRHSEASWDWEFEATDENFNKAIDGSNWK